MAPMRKPPSGLKPRGPAEGKGDAVTCTKDGPGNQRQAVDNRCAAGQELCLQMEPLDAWPLVARNRQKSKHSGGQTQEGLSGGDVAPFPEKEGSWAGKHSRGTGWGRKTRKPVISRRLVGKMM